VASKDLPGVSITSLGRVLIDVWAESAEDHLRALLRDGLPASAGAASVGTASD
jgi:hypothetical protein